MLSTTIFADDVAADTPRQRLAEAIRYLKRNESKWPMGLKDFYYRKYGDTAGLTTKMILEWLADAFEAEYLLEGDSYLTQLERMAAGRGEGSFQLNVLLAESGCLWVDEKQIRDSYDMLNLIFENKVKG